MNKVFKIAAIVLMGMVLAAGCGNDDTITYPAGVQSYVTFPGTNGATSPQVAFDGTNYLVVFDLPAPPPQTDHDIIGALVSPAGFVLTYLPIDNIPGSDTRAPRVAFDGTNYLVVYEQIEGGPDHNIAGALVNTTGTLLAGSPFVIDFSADDDIAPTVAFDGTNYLVAYEEAVSNTDHNIKGARLSKAGGLLSSIDIDTSTNDDRAPAIAFGGGNYLVTYEETVGGGGHNIRGTFVSPAGSVLAGSPFDIDASANDDIAPAVASDGTDFLVAYQRVFSTDNDIYGRVVSATGPPVSGPIQINARINVDDAAPAVAFDNVNHNYLVVYQETFSSTDHDIIGTRVNSAGMVNLNEVAIDKSGLNDLTPALAFGTTNYFVAYELVSSSSNSSIFGARVTP